MAFYSYLSTKIIIAFITKSYQNLFGVRSYINAKAFMILLLFRIFLFVARRSSLIFVVVAGS